MMAQEPTHLIIGFEPEVMELLSRMASGEPSEAVVDLPHPATVVANTPISFREIEDYVMEHLHELPTDRPVREALRLYQEQVIKHLKDVYGA